MNTCQHCGYENSDEASSCPCCGIDLLLNSPAASKVTIPKLPIWSTRRNGGSLRSVAPTALYELAMLLFLLGSPVLRFLGGMAALLFILSPIMIVYTGLVAYRAKLDRNDDAMWCALLLLMPLLFTGWIGICWLFGGQPLLP